MRERPELEGPTSSVVEELRRRLGSAFTVSELAALYAGGTDWAADVAWRAGASGDTSPVVDAGFGRYAREASDYGGGRR